jgi:HSP20 family protein
MAQNDVSRGERGGAEPRKEGEEQRVGGERRGSGDQRGGEQRGGEQRSGGGRSLASSMAPLTPFSLLSQFFEDAMGVGLGREMRPFRPTIELFEEGDQLVVRADLPGVKEEDLELHIENDALIIAGERRDERVEEREGYYRSERSYGSFQRAIPLPTGVDPATCDARFEHGVLEVRVKQPEPRQRARQIPIRGAQQQLEAGAPPRKPKN